MSWFPLECLCRQLIGCHHSFLFGSGVSRDPLLVTLVSVLVLVLVLHFEQRQLPVPDPLLRISTCLSTLI